MLSNLKSKHRPDLPQAFPPEAREMRNEICGWAQMLEFKLRLSTWKKNGN